MFLSLIIEFCRRARVKEHLDDIWVTPKTLIYSLMIWGEGALGKSKKSKVELSRSMADDMDSSRTSSAGPFEERSGQI